jgi:ABC-type Na+ efflux pump permease subunit
MTLKPKRILAVLAIVLLLCGLLGTAALAAGTGDVAGAVESTWQTASTQIKTVVNNVVFPAIDLILAVFFFVKLGTAYFDYRKSGQFEWTSPAILFACLVFTLTAPLYLWGIIGM